METPNEDIEKAVEDLIKTTDEHPIEEEEDHEESFEEPIDEAIDEPDIKDDSVNSPEPVEKEESPPREDVLYKPIISKLQIKEDSPEETPKPNPLISVLKEDAVIAFQNLGKKLEPNLADKIVENKGSSEDFLKKSPLTKLANVKSVLSSVMKTSISQVLRNKIGDASKNESGEAAKGEATISNPRQKARKSLSQPDSVPSPTTSEKKNSSKEVNSKEALKIAAAKKKKKRKFKGGTYKLYLSSSKKKKKSPKKLTGEQPSKDDCSSVTETTGTGSLADSEYDEDGEQDSIVSENYTPSDDVSIQDDASVDYSFLNMEMKVVLERNLNDCHQLMMKAQRANDEEEKDLSSDENENENDNENEEEEEDQKPKVDDFDENSGFAKPKDVSQNDPSSIASSVKSRQRMKRKLQDDHIDFDTVSIDSSHSNNSDSGSVPKKAKKSLPSNNSKPPSPVNGPEFSPKVEYPVEVRTGVLPSCTCLSFPLELNIESNDQEEVYCQALDSLDDKLIGCCNTVTNKQLVRAAFKVPFIQMCDVHLWRLRHHHCCPGCGVFCSQGSFYKCVIEKNNKLQTHLFHRKCRMASDTASSCLHCGSTAAIKSVRLEMNMPTAPVFYMSQKPIPTVPKAKITIGRKINELEEDDSETKSFKVPNTEIVFSTAGLPVGADRLRLEQMITSLSNLPESVPDFIPLGDLHYPAYTGNFETLLQLLVAGCDPNKKYEEHDNETALHAASKEGQLLIIHLLIQAGSCIDALDSKLYTPFMLAVENRQLEVVKYLIKIGAHLDAKGEDGMTSLHLAAKEGDIQICKLLLDIAKLNVNVQDDGGWTPLVWASEHRHIDIIRLLMSRGADPNIRDNEENTGLHWSSYSGSLDISHILLDNGCDLTAVNIHGDTPLHIASRQNNHDVVVLFLDRGADVTLCNKEGKTALMCCHQTNSDTWYALRMNEELRRLTSNIVLRTERVISTDISRGKELHPIQCVNGIDDEPPPSDYLYVTENCETSSMNIDRTITSLQCCRCEDDCSTPKCTCAIISFKCWFDKDGILLPEFNMLDPPMIFECNRACLCWKNCNNRMIQHGVSCRLQLFRVEGKGWGVRALKDIPKGTFICEYVGEMITDSEADHREDDSYLFDLDNKDTETYCLDARHYGNISRFINHLCEPNIVPVKVFVDHQDLSFPRIAFFSSRDISAFEELGFDYGEKFWVIKYKSFTCCCGSAKCKYSEYTIQDTLDNYNRRLNEEQTEEEQTGIQWTSCK